MSLDVLSTACRQRHRPCGTRRVSTSTAYPAFECILAVVPHPLVSISETAGGHEGRWECQPHNAEKPSPVCVAVRRGARYPVQSGQVGAGGSPISPVYGWVLSLVSEGGLKLRIFYFFWSTWSAVINRTSRAGELRSAPSGPDDWHRVAGKRALALGVPRGASFSHTEYIQQTGRPAQPLTI